MEHQDTPDAAEGNDAADAETERRLTLPGRFSVFAKVAFCLVAVVVADVLFYGAPMGWMSGMYLLLLAGLVLVVHKGPPDPAQGFVFGWVVLISLSLVVSVSPLSFMLGVVSLLSLYSIRRFSQRDHAFSFLFSLSGDVLRMLLSPVLDSYAMLRVSGRFNSDDRGMFSRATRWVLDWVIPAGLLVVFIFLFSLANPIFSSVFLPLRVLFWIVMGVLVWGLLRFPRAFSFLPLRGLSMSFVWDRIPRISPEAVTRSLLVFNLLFLIQNGLDVMYLWGGRALPEGMSYAEYAHRGSYPLVVTALLAAVFVLISFRSGEKPGRMKWARRLVYVWIAQNIFLLCSAAWRLWIYVDFYGLSRWRVATVIWMVLVAMGFLYIFLRIVGGWTNRWLINVNAATAIVLLSVCAFVNVDRAIADYNVAHCKEVSGEGASIDVWYLGRLGPDALPALQRILPHVDDPRKRKRITNLRRKFTKRLVRSMKDWRGYTYRRISLLEETSGSSSKNPEK